MLLGLDLRSWKGTHSPACLRVGSESFKPDELYRRWISSLHSGQRALGTPFLAGAASASAIQLTRRKLA